MIQTAAKSKPKEKMKPVRSEFRFWKYKQEQGFTFRTSWLSDSGVTITKAENKTASG
jgi:hypothetical protein